MADVYFIDESGNSGDIATEKAWQGFSGQPFFSLACIGVNDEKALDDFAESIIKTYKIQSQELKSVSVFRNKIRIVNDIINFLIDQNSNILIEVVNKKYQICIALVDFYIISYLDSSAYNKEQGKLVKREFCDFIYENIEESQMKDFIAAFSSGEDEITSIEKCLYNMRALCEKHTESPIPVSFVDDSIEVFNFMKKNLGNIETKKKFLPLPDISGERKYGILPNMNCLSDIYARINKIEEGASNITIFHDEQKEFCKPLNDVLHLVESMSSEESLVTTFADFNISTPLPFSFVPSTTKYGIQFADLIAGAFMRHVQAVSLGSDTHPEFIEAYRKIVCHHDNVKVGVNLVIPSHDVDTLRMLSM